MPLTVEERERRAHIEGNVELAAALGGEIDDHADSLSELEHDLSSTKDELKATEEQLAAADEENAKLEDRISELEREFEDAGLDLV